MSLRPGSRTRSMQRARVSTPVFAWFKDYVVYDSFDRANSNSTLGTSDTGQTYFLTADSPPTWGITNNLAYAVGNVAQSTASINSGLWDCTLEVTISNSITDSGVSFRVIDNANNFVSNALSLFVRVGGSFTNLGTWTYGVGDTLKVEMYGSSIKCFTNDVLQLSITNTNHLRATRHGMRKNGSAEARWNNLKITL